MNPAPTCLWFLVCMFLTGCACLQKTARPDPFDPALLMQQTPVQVPLINGGNLQWRVSATVNGQPGIFILDTGAEFTSITPQFAKKVGLLDRPGRKVKYVPIDSFKLGDADYYKFYAAVLDLDHINRAMHSQVAGIIGNNLLNQTAYVIDWQRNRLTLDSRMIEVPSNAIPISVRNNRVFCAVRVNGKSVEFALDTGAYRCLLSENELSQLAIPNQKRSMVDTPQIDIQDSRTHKQMLVKLDEFGFGPVKRTDYPMLLWTHCVLGMDLLQHYILTVDARKNWLLLSERTSPLLPGNQ